MATSTTTFVKKPLSPGGSAALTLKFLSLLLPSILALLFISFHSPAIIQPLSLPRTLAPRNHIPGLRCVRVIQHYQTTEGIGSTLKLQQFAIFVASYFNTGFGFNHLNSTHGYDYAKIFSDCGIVDDKKFPEKCKLQQEEVFMEVCPRADCDCIGEQVEPYVREIVNRGCPVVGVVNDGFRRLEYSGCLSNAMKRYLGTTGPPPKWQYDVVHYRRGDLAHNPGHKSFQKDTLWFLMRQLCERSDRDIVVITQGSPEIPECPDKKDRIVIADTGLKESFQIMQHANAAAVGISTFAVVMLEVARPTRMVMEWDSALFYLWVDCEKWTLITAKGSILHFRTKAEMLAWYTSRMDPEKNFRNYGGHLYKNRVNARYNMSVPKRRWTPVMMAPAKIRHMQD